VLVALRQRGINASSAQTCQHDDAKGSTKMTQLEHQTALIVGVGQGLSAALARLFAEQGFRIALASRDTTKLASLCEQTGAIAIDCDVTDANQVARLFEQVDKRLPPVDVVVYNPSARSRGPFVELVPADVQRALMVTALGGFLVGQQAARRMLPRRSGAILFTGASASVKGYPQSAPFAMAKFALRGLVQSMARELAPQGIHVAHFVIDGAIRPPGHDESTERPDAMLDPDAIAASYLHVLRQPRSAWTWEIELRPWTEKF
jgi:NAD(P)-dependent dehydrogenase (short-subunit alcohol dehydrogenase family)